MFLAVLLDDFLSLYDIGFAFSNNLAVGALLSVVLFVALLLWISFCHFFIHDLESVWI